MSYLATSIRPTLFSNEFAVLIEQESEGPGLYGLQYLLVGRMAVPGVRDYLPKHVMQQFPSDPLVHRVEIQGTSVPRDSAGLGQAIALGLELIPAFDDLQMW